MGSGSCPRNQAGVDHSGYRRHVGSAGHLGLQTPDSGDRDLGLLFEHILNEAYQVTATVREGAGRLHWGRGTLENEGEEGHEPK